MNNRNRLKPQDVTAIINLTTIHHYSPQCIAKMYSISRQAVWKMLRKHGVNTHKGPGGGTRVTVYCDYCGLKHEITRARWRHHREHFHNAECYYAHKENPQYYQSRQGQRLARAIVAQHFNLQPEHVVHHKDGNTTHNDLSNLAVYASQSDHIKATHHKNSTILPIWES